MKPHPEDPRIIAYVLGELNEDETAEIEHLVETDPSTRRAIEETRDFQRLLKERLAPPRTTLHPHQRENIFRAANLSSTTKKNAFYRLPGWIVPIAAVAVITLSVLLFFRTSTEKSKISIKESPTTTSPVAETREQPAPLKLPPTPIQSIFANSGFLSVLEFPTLDLPILPGKPNLTPLNQPIREAGKLPSHDTIRIEELLNSFPLRLNGTSAIARSPNSTWHPDKRDPGINGHLATLSTEMIACPWKPSATLLLIHARANSQNDCNLKITFHPNAANAIRYRLLGFDRGKDEAPKDMPTQLKAGAYTTIAIEIESSKPSTELGLLKWSAGGTIAPTITLIHKADAEPSDDARFASLVSSFAQWLAGEQTGVLDREILSALVRENSSVTIPPDHTDFIRLVETSLQLQAE